MTTIIWPSDTTPKTTEISAADAASIQRALYLGDMLCTTLYCHDLPLRQKIDRLGGMVEYLKDRDRPITVTRLLAKRALFCAQLATLDEQEKLMHREYHNIRGCYFESGEYRKFRETYSLFLKQEKPKNTFDDNGNGQIPSLL